MLTVYGLKNCDTCRKAMKWLSENDIDCAFLDVRKDGVDKFLVEKWVSSVGWETLLNRRGTTWRGLSDADKENIDQSRAVDLMVAHPALIKRPVFDQGGDISVGFKDADKARFK